MTLRQVGCLAAGICVLAVWGGIIAFTWESTPGIIACGVLFFVSIAIFVVQGFALQRRLEAEQRENLSRLGEATGPIERKQP